MQDVPIIVSEINGPAIFRARMSEFTGSESMYDKLPAWVVDSLLHVSPHTKNLRIEQISNY